MNKYLPAGIFLISALTFGIDRNIDLIFSHKQHVRDVGADCIDCHINADSSASPRDNLLPAMKDCYFCHDENAACTMCHEDPETSTPYPRIVSYIGKFDHSQHLQADMSCLDCHKGTGNSSNIYDSHLPAMTYCVTCHGELEKPDYCMECHNSNDDLLPRDHRTGWRAGHGPAGYLASHECAICHTDRYCLECHDGDNLDRTVHPLNYKFNHAIAARGKQENCYTCHQDLMFCNECHRAELVMPRTHSSAGWSNRQNGGLHARAARMDMDNCAACHSDAGGNPVCIECHQAR